MSLTEEDSQGASSLRVLAPFWAQNSVCKDKYICLVFFHESCKVSRFCGNANYISTKVC